jgi:pantoate--beta-alanine ligase
MPFVILISKGRELMQVVEQIKEVRTEVHTLKAQGKTVAFVPTMGALHEGHLSLMRTAKQHADAVVVSIYVNPTQFAPDEDYEAYPRDRDADLDKCKLEGVDVVFMPTDDIMYGGDNYISFEINELGDHLCGATRDGHFEGVIQIVNKLFNIVTPDVAVFGQKDIQQFIILDHMVKEFCHPIQMVRGDIVRANDGLALSSRNAYLSDEQRTIAPGLYRSLTYIKEQIKNGVTEPEMLINHQKDELRAKGFEIDYIQAVDYDTLSPVRSLKDTKRYIIAGAVYLGQTRLIDNVILTLD